MIGRSPLPLLGVAALALALAAPAVATADEPALPSATTAAATTPTQTTPAPPPPTTPPTTPTPPPPVRRAPKPRRARIGVSFSSGVYHVGSATLTVPGRVVRISGRIVPYVPHQQVNVRVWVGSKLAKSVKVTPKPTKTKQTATFTARFTAGKAAAVKVFAVHDATERQRKAESKAAKVSVVTPSAGFGSSGPFVGLLQQQLAKLGYAVPRDSQYGPATGRAVLAFRKVNGMARIETLDGAVVDKLLRGVGGFHVRFPQHGRHVEANLGQQVLALIENGKVYKAFITSSGKPSTPTVLGNFRFYLKTPGTNQLGMVDSNYFIRGYAIHGYADVPTYNASHGCLRIPVPDAAFVFNWVHIGDQIDVYY